MKDLIKYSTLLSFYKSLFTKKQIKYLDEYFNKDMSLQEIALANKVSRAAIHDMINKSKKQLISYEAKLKLLEKENKRQELYKIIKEKNIVKELNKI